MNTHNLKLGRIIRDYPYFEENQVLTADQLNTIVDYLDQQNRLTRRNLLGYGVVCGLKVGYNNQSIGLTKGCGLTTDGDLLELPVDTIFSNFKEFKDEQAKYPLFENKVVYELIPDTEENHQDSRSLSVFKKHTEQRLEDQAVLLYLESYLYDPDLCTGGDCDNKGQSQVNRLRVLLISKESLSRQISGFSAAKQYFDLKHVYMPRLKLHDASLDNLDKLSAAYLSLIKKTAKDFSANLEHAFRLLLPALIDGSGNANPVNEWIKKLNSIITKAGSDKLFAQSVYSLMKDLSLAYNEFIESVFHWEDSCLPHIQSSPKHLLLGDATAAISDQADHYRQQFVPAPALRNTSNESERMRFLFRRVGLMISSFQGPKQKEIKITPSNINGVTGQKSIPAYYSIKNELNKNWSFEKHLRGRNDEILSYHSPDYSNIDAVNEPVDFCWDEYDMYRIEGHIGQNFKSALERIEHLIRTHNLAFKVLPLLIEHDRKQVYVFPKYKYYGMEILHKLYRDELLHNLNDLKTFSTELNSKVQAAQDEDLPPVDIESNTLSMKAFADQQTQIVKQKIDQTKSFLASSIVEFDSDNFETTYRDVVQQSAVFNKGIKGVTYASAFTPMDKTVNNITFSKLKWIKDLVKKREEKVQEKGILVEFLKEHPGMEHMGGVPKGGTFFLIFSASTNQVVADFSLPYMYYEEPVQEVPEGSDASDENKVFDWKLNNNLQVYVNQNHLLKNQILNLDDKIGKIQLDLNTQAINLGSYQGSINTLIQTLPTYTFPGIDGNIAGGGSGISFDNPDLGKNYGMMKEIDGYKKYLTSKENSNTITEAERSILDDLGKIETVLIEDTVEKAATSKNDIRAGSGDDLAIETAINNFNLIKEGASKDRIIKKVKDLGDQAKDKTNIAGRLKMFKK